MQIALDAVGHRFTDGPWLFHNLSYTLTSGHSYALTGPSGSGKSTLLSILAGWEKPAAGVVTKDGVERIGWVFQNPHGVARRTVLDHVTLPLLAQRTTPASARREALHLLETFGLDRLASQQFRSLSGGESQRLMLARGVASAPDLFLIDEPTAQLDVQTSHDVNHAITQLADEGRIVVVATHDEETRGACSDVVDLRDYQLAKPAGATEAFE